MAAGTYGTNYTETEALLAVQSEDEDEARRIIDDMLPGERRRLAAAASRLASLCLLYCDNCDKRVESISDLVTLGVGREAPRVCKFDAEEYASLRKQRRQVERARRDLVLTAAERAGWYATLIEETGIDGQRLVGIRDGDTEPTDEEMATLRRYVEEGS